MGKTWLCVLVGVIVFFPTNFAFNKETKLCESSKEAEKTNLGYYINVMDFWRNYQEEMNYIAASIYSSGVSEYETIYASISQDTKSIAFIKNGDLSNFIKDNKTLIEKIRAMMIGDTRYLAMIKTGEEYIDFYLLSTNEFFDRLRYFYNGTDQLEEQRGVEVINGNWILIREYKS